MFLKYLFGWQWNSSSDEWERFFVFQGFLEMENIIFETEFIGFGLFIGDFFKYFANLQVIACG